MPIRRSESHRKCLARSSRKGRPLGCMFFAHLLCMRSDIFTVKGSLKLGMDSHSLASERTSLMQWASIPRVSNSEFSILWRKETDNPAARLRFIAVDFMFVLSIVLPCDRYST